MTKCLKCGEMSVLCKILEKHGCASVLKLALIVDIDQNRLTNICSSKSIRTMQYECSLLRSSMRKKGKYEEIDKDRLSNFVKKEWDDVKNQTNLEYNNDVLLSLSADYDPGCQSSPYNMAVLNAINTCHDEFKNLDEIKLNILCCLVILYIISNNL